MLLASVEDLGKRLGRTLAVDTPDFLRAEADLEDISTFAMSVAGVEWTDETVPDDVRVVVLGAAKRKFQNPEGYRSETAGEFTVERDAYTTSMFSSFELDVLRKYRPGAGLGVIHLTRGDGEDGIGVRYRAEYPGGFFGSDIVG